MFLLSSCSFVTTDASRAGDKFETLSTNNGYSKYMRLKIRNVGPNDFGSYRCVAKNSLGETDGLIKLDGNWNIIRIHNAYIYWFCSIPWYLFCQFLVCHIGITLKWNSINVRTYINPDGYVYVFIPEIPAPTTTMSTDIFGNRTNGMLNQAWCSSYILYDGVLDPIQYDLRWIYIRIIVQYEVCDSMDFESI